MLGAEQLPEKVVGRLGLLVGLVGLAELQQIADGVVQTPGRGGMAQTEQFVLDGKRLLGEVQGAQRVAGRGGVGGNVAE